VGNGISDSLALQSFSMELLSVYELIPRHTSTMIVSI
jgi:hypothetical protein